MSGLFSKPKAPSAPDPRETGAMQSRENRDIANYNTSMANPYLTSPLFDQKIKFPFDTTLIRKDVKPVVSQPTQQQQQQKINPIGGNTERDQTYASKYVQSILGKQSAQPQQQIQQSIAAADTGYARPTVNFSFGKEIDAGIQDLKSIIGRQLSRDISPTSPQAYEDAYFANATKDIDAQFLKARQTYDAEAARRGWTAGSEAYERGLRALTDSYNSALSNARVTSMENARAAQSADFALASAAQNQPLAVYGNLIGLQDPYIRPNVQGIAPVDYTGLVQQNYAQQMEQYKSQVAQQSAKWNTIGQIAGSAIPLVAGGFGGGASYTAPKTFVDAGSGTQLIIPPTKPTGFSNLSKSGSFN